MSDQSLVQCAVSAIMKPRMVHEYILQQEDTKEEDEEEEEPEEEEEEQRGGGQVEWSSSLPALSLKISSTLVSPLVSPSLLSLSVTPCCIVTTRDAAACFFCLIPD